MYFCQTTLQGSQIVPSDSKNAPKGVLPGTTARPLPDACALEIEVVDIARIERGRRSKNDFALRPNGALAELTRVERLAFLAGNRPRRERRSGIGSEVPELVRIP